MCGRTVIGTGDGFLAWPSKVAGAGAEMNQRSGSRTVIAGVVLASVFVGCAAWLVRYYVWQTQYLEPARLEVRGITTALMVYIKRERGRFPVSFEDLRRSGVVAPFEQGAREPGYWHATPDEAMPAGLTTPGPFPFRPEHLIVRWGFDKAAPNDRSGVPIVGHVRLRADDDTVIECTGSIRILMRICGGSTPADDGPEAGGMVTPPG